MSIFLFPHDLLVDVFFYTVSDALQDSMSRQGQALQLGNRQSVFLRMHRGKHQAECSHSFETGF